MIKKKGVNEMLRIAVIDDDKTLLCDMHKLLIDLSLLMILILP